MYASRTSRLTKKKKKNRNTLCVLRVGAMIVGDAVLGGGGGG